MPALTGVSSLGRAGSVAAVNVTIALTGVSARVVAGFVTPRVIPGEGLALRAPLPAITFTGVTGTAPITLSIKTVLPTLALTGTTGTYGTVALRTPTPALALTGVTGSLGSLVLTTPRPAITMASGGGLAIKALKPTLALTGVTGVTGTLTLRTPAPALTLAGGTPLVGSLAAVSVLPTIALAGITGTAGSLSIPTALPTLKITGTQSVLGVLSLAAPLPTMALSGYFAALGTLVLTPPRPSLKFAGVAPNLQSQVDAARTTFALQTVRMALTNYSNFPFNSFAFFNGQFLGAKGDGIFTLGGASDAGTSIDAYARFGITDMNTSHLKRVERVYVGCRTSGQLVLRVTTDENKQRDYAVPVPTRPGLHGGHVRIGPGVIARYWQFELRNQGGADFTVDTVEFKPTALPSRVGDSDA